MAGETLLRSRQVTTSAAGWKSTVFALPPPNALPTVLKSGYALCHCVVHCLVSGDKVEMRCIAAAVAGFIALIAPASAQDSRLKAALTACMTQAVTHPLPQMLDVDNAAAVVYACEGQPAFALFTAMEPVSDQTIEGDVIARRAGSIVCSSHGPMD